MQIMYGIMGQRRLLEWEADWLPGYEGAQPVRIGNAAHAQLQLDVYGELMDAFHQSRVAKLKLDDGTWDLECKVLEHLAEVWDQPDHGIWERRGDGKHYVSSKVMTWVAFDRAIKSAEKFGFEAPLEQWRELARHHPSRRLRKGLRSACRIRSSNPTDRNCSMPASCCCRRWAFCRRTDPRVRGTLAAIEKYMMRDGFVLRHDPREVSDEKQPIEGAFLACSLWLADAYVLAGEIDKAQALFDRVVGVANDLGLLAEEYDSGAGRQTGNFPQALTHIALINTAHNLSDAKKPVAIEAGRDARTRTRSLRQCADDVRCRSVRDDESLLSDLVVLHHDIDRPGKTLVLVRRRDMRRLPLDVVGRVAHRDRQAASSKHRQIVLHVADRGDRVGRNAQALGHRLHEGALVVAGRRDVEIIALRAGRGGLRADGLLHRGFAALQQRRIGSSTPTILQAADR